MITYNISVNPSSERSICSDMEFTVGDVKAYRLQFSFSGIETEGKTLLIKALRGDGSVVTASSGSCEIILPAVLYAVAGEVSFEVSLIDGMGCCVTLCVITATVRPAFDDGIAAEVDKYPVLTDILTRLQALENERSSL